MKQTLLKKIQKQTNTGFIGFIRKIVTRVQEAEISNSAVILAYYALLSLFPFLILVGNLLPYLNLKPEWILPYIQTAVPETIYHSLESTIRSLLTSRNGGLLSIGVFATIWAASRGINAMQISMNKAYCVTPRKNVFFVRIASLVIVLLLIVSVAAVIVAFVFGQLILGYLTPKFNLPEEILSVFQTLKWPVTMFTLLIVLWVLYYFVPNVKLKLKNAMPGAIFTTIGWLILSQAFAIYVRYFSSSVSNYGTIGTVVVLLLWLNFSGYILSLGAIINAVLDEQLHGEIEEGRSSFLISNKKDKEIE